MIAKANPSPKKTRFQFRLSSFLIIVTLIGLGLAYPELRFHYLLVSMRNSDLVFSDDGQGIQATNATQRIIEDYGIRARSGLRKRLADPKRFAAAHTALVEVTGVRVGACWMPGPGEQVQDRLHFIKDELGELHFSLLKNQHLQQWWTETVRDNRGIPIWDEQSEQLCWIHARTAD